MKLKYYLAVITAFLIYGFFSLPLKAVGGYAALDILLSRVVLSSILLVGICFTFRYKQSRKTIIIFRQKSRKERNKLWLVNIGSALMLALNWYTFIYAMNNISVNSTALAYMICPIITTVLAFLFLKDQLTKLQWIAVFLSMGSCALLMFGSLRDVFFSFVIGSAYAIYLVLQKNNNQLDRFFTLAFQIVCATLILSPLFFYQQEVPTKGSFYYTILFLIAAGFTIFPMYLNVFALDGLSSSTAGIFIYLNPIFAFLLALFYFDEQMGIIKIIAYSIVFLSVILFNWKVMGNLKKKSHRLESQ